MFNNYYYDRNDIKNTYYSNSLDNILIDLLLTLFSGFTRAFLDTILKHLFEFDYLNPFKVLIMKDLLVVFFSYFFIYIMQPLKINSIFFIMLKIII